MQTQAEPKKKHTKSKFHVIHSGHIRELMKTIPTMFKDARIKEETAHVLCSLLLANVDAFVSCIDNILRREKRKTIMRNDIIRACKLLLSGDLCEEAIKRSTVMHLKFTALKEKAEADREEKKKAAEASGEDKEKKKKPTKDGERAKTPRAAKSAKTAKVNS